MLTTRTTGAIGMLGGLVYAVAGARLLVLGVPEDRVTDLLGVIWALSWVVAGRELLQLRVTGSSMVAWGASVVLLLGFCMATLWGCYRIVDPVAADRSPVAVAPVVVILGMLGTGVLVPLAGVWGGWRRFVPLGIAMVYVATVGTTVSTGAPTLGHAFLLAGLGYVALGSAIRTAPAPEPAVEVAAAPQGG